MKNNSQANSYPSPLLLSICLSMAVTMCSSSAVVFNTLTTVKGVSPFLAAFWRLFLQTVVQLIPFLLSLYQARKEDHELEICEYWESEEGGLALDVTVDTFVHTVGPQTNTNSNLNAKNRDKSQATKGEVLPIIPRFISSLPLMALSGCFLGIHFSMWVYSLRYTSITHSLLWVSMGPILLNGGCWALYFLSQTSCIQKVSSLTSTSSSSWTVKAPSIFETFGALLGVAGASFILLDITTTSTSPTSNTVIHNYHEPTIHGDMAAFSGAAAVVLYLLIGQNMRSWLSIWLYMFPVVGFAMFTCAIFAILDKFEETSIVTTATVTNTSSSLDSEDFHECTNATLSSFTSSTSSSSMTLYHYLFHDLFTFEYFWYALYLGIGPGICGHTVLNMLLKYISPLIISTAMLLEPIVGSIIGYLVGMQPLPGVWTLVGGPILLLGLAMIVVGENKDNNIDGDDDDGGEIDGDCKMKAVVETKALLSSSTQLDDKFVTDLYGSVMDEDTTISY